MKSTQQEYTYYLDVSGHEYELTVLYTYYPAYKGGYEGGQQVEPDEEAYIEVYKVMVDVGSGVEDFPLSQALENEIVNEIMNSGGSERDEFS
jgi:hypothetical protein